MRIRQGLAWALVVALLLAGCGQADVALPTPPPIEQRIAAMGVSNDENGELAQCEAHPVPWFASWRQEDFAALCRHFHTRVIQRHEIEQAFTQGGAAALHRMFAQRRIALDQGETHADALIWDFQGFYWSGDDTLAMAEAWVAAFPQDASAQLALAEALRSVWWEARGERLASETPDENLQRASLVLARITALARRASALEPANPMAPYVLMDALSRQGGNAEAFEVLTAALEHHPDSYLLRQRALVAALPAWGGRISDARAVSKTAEDAAARNPVVGFLQTSELTTRAFDARSRQSDEEALPLWMEAFHTGFDSDSLVHAADSAFLTGDELLGAEFRTLQLRVFGPNAKILMRRARSWGAIHRIDLAEADLDHALRLAPRNPDVVFERGALAAACNDVEMAAARYREALGLDPGHYYAALALGELQVWTLKQSSEAAPMLEQALQRKPGDARLLYVLADAYAVIEDPRARATAKAYLEAIDLDSTDPQTRWRINYIRELIPQLP